MEWTEDEKTMLAIVSIGIFIFRGGSNLGPATGAHNACKEASAMLTELKARGWSVPPPQG